MLWGGGAPERARAWRAEGARVRAWTAAAARSLAADGVDAEEAPHLGPGGTGAVEGAARTWARVWGLRPLAAGQSFRELVVWKDLPLWWTAEQWFRTESEAVRAVATIERLALVLEAERPAEVEASGLDAVESVLLARAATALGVFHHATPPRVESALGTWRSRAQRDRWTAAARRLSPFRRRMKARGPALPVLVLAETEEAAALPMAALRHRGFEALPVIAADLTDPVDSAPRGEAARGRRELEDAWRRLGAAAGVQESFVHRDVRFFDLAEGDLAALFLVVLPRRVGLYEAVRGILVRGGAAAAVLALASRDERRTALAAAAAERVPTLVLRAEPASAGDADRDDGGPRADQMLSGPAADDPERVAEAVAALARGRVKAP